MSILLTGGTGKTGVPLAHLLNTETTHPILLASRKGVVPNSLGQSPNNKLHGVTFDWFNRTSWDNPFKYTEVNNLPAIDRVLLIGPLAWDVGFMNDFVDLAKERGVKRFVLLSASQTGSGGLSTGQVHAHLEKLAEKEDGIEFTVLRPSWFSENFGETLLPMIRDENVIYSVCEDGKIPFISAEDIAAAAFKGLMDEKSPNTDWYLHGPELLTQDEAVGLLSTVLGRTIKHVRATKEDYIKFWDDLGASLGFSDLGQGFFDAEQGIANGSEEAIFRHEKAVVGKVSLGEYFAKNRHLWVKDE